MIVAGAGFGFGAQPRVKPSAVNPVKTASPSRVGVPLPRITIALAAECRPVFDGVMPLSAAHDTEYCWLVDATRPTPAESPAAVPKAICRVHQRMRARPWNPTPETVCGPGPSVLRT